MLEREPAPDVVADAGANAAAVAEQAMALVLACAKSVVHLDERMHAGPWDKAAHKSVELSGPHRRRRGPGRDRPAFRAHGACDGHACDRLRSVREEPARLRGAVTLEEIWRQSDVISLHCPLTDDNRNLVAKQAMPDR